MNTFQTLDTAALYESPLNPRKHFNQAALDELTGSIAVHGVLQPLLVRPDNKGQYEIVNGARRYRAAIAAGLAMVPAMIREMTDALLIEAKEEIKAAELAKKPKKTPKKSRSVPSEDTLPTTEAAQAGDLLRVETAGGAIEAAPAGGENPLEEATAEEQSSASVDANETPSDGVPGFAVGDTVRVLDVPSPDLGIPPRARGKGGEITMIYLDGRRAPIVVMIEGDELLFDPVQLQRIAWREEKAIETDEKPSGSTRTPVKYRHPENNELEWTGRGRKPKWVEHCLTNGMTLQQLEIAA